MRGCAIALEGRRCMLVLGNRQERSIRFSLLTIGTDDWSKMPGEKTKVHMFMKGLVTGMDTNRSFTAPLYIERADLQCQSIDEATLLKRKLEDEANVIDRNEVPPNILAILDTLEIRVL